MSGGGPVPRLGAFLFRNRGWLPAPLLVAMCLSPVVHPVAGGVLVAAGEALRLWAVGHIGLPSRTRGDGAHRVVRSGPYGRVRNPLYIGNVLIFAGIGVVVWPWALVAVPLLCLHYTAIVRWEESNLAARLGAPYQDYLATVPRWWPSAQAALPGRWDGREALRSERTTLGVLALVVAVLGARVLR